MVKHVEGWRLKKSIDKNHNVYVKHFSGAKVKCMKDYIKPSIREKNPDYVIFHVEQMSLTLSYHLKEWQNQISILQKTLNQTVE